MTDNPARVWRETLEAIPQIVWTADAAGRPDWFNARWYAYTGQSAAEALDEGYPKALQRGGRGALGRSAVQMSNEGEPGVPHPPYDELKSAAGGDPEAARNVEALRSELHADEPDPAKVEHHASLLRAIPVLEARIANWWDDPRTQTWVKAITDAGL